MQIKSKHHLRQLPSVTLAPQTGEYTKQYPLTHNELLIYIYYTCTVVRRLTTAIRSEKYVVHAISSLFVRHSVYLHKPR